MDTALWDLKARILNAPLVTILGAARPAIRVYGLGEYLRKLRAFKRIWDPDNKMNPGKIVDAYRADENLRLGTSYNPPSMSTHFRYEQDGGNFSRTLLRCLGVGECRKKSGTPAVRGATEETLLIATGFSCREQIRQTTGRRTMHPAEVVELAFSA